ncbi:hypothetical protein Hanom_Chr10g00946151 [Helianthus anomalus]
MLLQSDVPVPLPLYDLPAWSKFWSGALVKPLQCQLLHSGLALVGAVLLWHGGGGGGDLAGFGWLVQ